MNYTVHYEIAINGKIIADDITTEAKSEEEAVKRITYILNMNYLQEYWGAVLLKCQARKQGE